MPEVFSIDKETALIVILFSIIIGAGLDSFIKQGVFFDDLSKWHLESSSNSTSVKESNHVPLNNYLPPTFSLLFFIGAFLLIILHWIIYHKIIAIHPYQKESNRFFIDILIFSFIFLIAVLSSLVYKDKSSYTFVFFVSLLIAFHICSLMWWRKRISETKTNRNQKQSEKKSPCVITPLILDTKDARDHNLMLIIYIAIALASITITSFSSGLFEEYLLVALMSSVVTLMIGYSIMRFRKYRIFNDDAFLTFNLDTNPDPDRALTHYKERQNDDKKYYWYHIRIDNRHTEKTAYDCVIYLVNYEEIRNGDSQKETLESVEFKWKGVNLKEVSIMPLSSRYFDAFYINDGHKERNVLHLGINHYLADYEDYEKKFQLCGTHYKVTFRLHSLNFPAKTDTFVIHNNGPNNSKIHKDEEKENSKCQDCSNLRTPTTEISGQRL